MLSGDRSLVLTADARIDNREELVAKLDIANKPLEKITDSELILIAYSHWGEHCVEHLIGDFAFAIWDQPQQKLFCARDHLGVKPLYYFYDPEHTFCFASEMKALLTFPWISQNINERRIADYLRNSVNDVTDTVYSNISRLPPAHTLVVSAAYGARLEQYWMLDPSHSLEMDSDEAYANAFFDLFAEAVHCRLRSAFPIGAHLSGGLDSSSVTCVARHLLAESGADPLHTFSNVFDIVEECDERPYINTVLHQGGLIAHYTYPDRVGPLARWQDMLQPREEPCLNGGNGYLVWILNQAAQTAGVRVSLDGFDGDTTVSHGFNRFAELLQQERWQEFAAEARCLAERLEGSPNPLVVQYFLPYLTELARSWRWIAFHQAIAQMSQHFRLPCKRLWLHGIKAILPSRMLRLGQDLRRRYAEDQEASSLIHPLFDQRTQTDTAVQSGRRGLPSQTSQRDEALMTVREAQWAMLTSPGLTLLLELQDIAAAAHSIEARHPFLDKRLVEFCLALPSHQKLHQGWSRIILRRAMKGFLPHEIQWRAGKMDMKPSFIKGLRQQNRALLDNVMTHDMEKIQDYVGLASLRKSYDRLTSGAAASDRDLMAVWTGTALALWQRQIESASLANSTESNSSVQLSLN
jgi:asparagine synthase (glutamine-hydrolysing)